ncbi:hypothetical protein ACFLV9_00300 [Chloroflexota bacterium]
MDLVVIGGVVKVINDTICFPRMHSCVCLLARFTGAKDKKVQSRKEITLMSLITSARKNIKAIFEHTSATTSTLEVLLAYPGFHTRQSHRLAHTLFRWYFPILPRLISHISQFLPALKFTARLG